MKIGKAIKMTAAAIALTFHTAMQGGLMIDSA
jgi:hypothetical protein